MVLEKVDKLYLISEHLMDIILQMEKPKKLLVLKMQEIQKQYIKIQKGK